MIDNQNIRHLILAGNALYAALDSDCETSEEFRLHALETWETTVDSVRKTLKRPRTTWVKSGLAATENGESDA